MNQTGDKKIGKLLNDERSISEYLIFEALEKGAINGIKLYPLVIMLNTQSRQFFIECFH